MSTTAPCVSVVAAGVTWVGSNGCIACITTGWRRVDAISLRKIIQKSSSNKFVKMAALFNKYVD